ncbi:hypothetical protein BC830DRAFT_1080447 [Chytriomyces sp. MP71]|nr:hypothetical protein BC830DRAFT_1080447 [Chytriomyces sp. MP71]
MALTRYTDALADPLLLLPAYANEHSLQPFYDIVAGAIRGVDANALIHFESSTLIQTEAGFTAVPGGAAYGNTSVFNFHYYTGTTTLSLDQVVQARVQTAVALGCGTILSEYEAGIGSGSESVVEVSRSADSALLSAIGWEYKEYDTVSIITGINDAVEDPLTGAVREDFGAAFSRTYAHAVAGVPVSMHFNDTTKVFVLLFNFNGATGNGAVTELRTNFAEHYPSGWKVLVVATSGAFDVLAGNGVSKNAIYLAPSDGKSASAGAGVAVAVYPVNGTVPIVTAPPAMTMNATPIATKNSGSFSSGGSYMVDASLVVLFLGLWLF